MKHAALAVFGLLLLSGPWPAQTLELAADPAHDYFQSRDFTSPMLSMELQYFRVPREKWDLMLSRMAQYHANTISTYVCWSWHEYEQGKFDFTGATIPERDLVGFIELVRKHRLNLVLKPGPFIDAELNAGGIPPWIWERYPETKAVTMEGKDFIHGDSGMPRLSYLHPRYLERVGIYYQAFADAVGKYQWPNGPVIAVQVDNESPGDGMLVTKWYLNLNLKADYNPYHVKILWPQWLEKQYADIDKLNQAYGSAYNSFAEVPMPNKWNDPKDARAFQIWIDLAKFADFQTVEGLRKFTEMMRKSGISVPTYQDLLCMPWDMAGIRADIGGMAEASGGWIGTNNYAEIFRIGSQFAGNPFQGLNWDEYVHLGVWRAKLSQSLSEPYPAFVPEITVAGNRFYFQNPIAWNADAVNIYVGHQVKPDNKYVAPHGSWGMEACVTTRGEVRECLFNGKLTYLFMEHSGGFMPDKQKPEIAIGYSHAPEHAWNWEYHWNFQLADKIVKLKDLRPLVAGANTGDRTQLIARDLVRQKVDFDVIELEHLKPGQLERYKLVLIPSTPYGPIPGSGDSLLRTGSTWQLYLSPGNTDYRLEFFESRGVKLRTAWADASEVDVVQRYRGAGQPVALSIINRGRDEFKGPVNFDAGGSRLFAAVGKTQIGFVAVQGDGIRAALLAHPSGRGEYRFKDDLVKFTGSFGALALLPDCALFSSPSAGRITVRSINLVKPARLIRLMISGATEDAPFKLTYDLLEFDYNPGSGSERTDMYVLLPAGKTLAQAIGEYLERTAKRE